MPEALQRGNKVKHLRMPLWGTGTVFCLLPDGQAQVEFPKTGRHTVRVADLQRHIWDVGARVRYEDMSGIVVEEIGGQLLHYRVQFPHKTAVIREDNLSSDLVDPCERLLAQDFDGLRYYDLRTRATYISAAYTFDDLVSLTNARVELKPHQVYVAHRVVQHPEPRFLLCDEVGLGKTIEAGMILKELRTRGLAERVLAVVPANLVSQWQSELQSKFNEDFLLYDSMRVRLLEQDRRGENPWSLAPRIITSLQFARREDRRDQIADVAWDLVIFDEAHHLRRYLEGFDQQGQPKVRNTLAYLLGGAISEKARSLLFLTATPLQLRSYELYSLVELADPSLFSGFEHFERFRVSTLRRVNEAHSLLSTDPRPDRYQRLRHVWEDLRGEAGGLRPLPPIDALTGPALAELREALRELHLISKVMIRNRRREIGGFSPRTAHVIPVALTSQELGVHESVSEYVREGYRAAEAAGDRIAGFLMVTFQKILASSTRALLLTLERRRAKLLGDAIEDEPVEVIAVSGSVISELSEVLAGEDGEWESQETSRVLARAQSASERVLGGAEVAKLDDLIARIRALPLLDSKANQLLVAVRGILGPYPEEKALIFTQFLETQRYLKELLESQGYAVQTFSGEMSASEKDAAIERFKGSSQVLISTEAGGEGRNFQFCHIMFNYDLPWNPMRIEQRIGRIDRIGQRKAVHIYNFAATGTIEERVLEVLQNRIRLFEETIGSLDPILGEFERDLGRLIMRSRGDFAKAFDNFGVDWEKKIADARAMEERLADFIMDVRSFRRDECDRLLARQTPVTHADLRELVRDFLGLYPTKAPTFEERPDGVLAIDVPRAFVEEIGGGARIRGRYVGTFDPQVALGKESIDFFAIGHELVDEIINHCRDRRFGGQAAVRILDSPSDRGFWGVQCNYLVEYTGVRSYPRFVPIVIGFDGEVDWEHSRRLASAKPTATPLPSFPAGWQEKAREAVRKSELTLIDHISCEITGLEQRNNTDHASLLNRIEKAYGYRQDRARNKLQESEATLSKFRQSDDPGGRMVIPIWEATAERDRLQVEILSRKRELEISGLEKRRALTYDFQLVSVALVHVPRRG